MARTAAIIVCGRPLCSLSGIMTATATVACCFASTEKSSITGDKTFDFTDGENDHNLAQLYNCLRFIRCSTYSPCFPSSPVSPLADDDHDVWNMLRREAESDVEKEPILRAFYDASLLSHSSLESALASYLASKLGDRVILTDVLVKVFAEVMKTDLDVGRSVRADLRAVKDRDPACHRTVHCFLYYKGFLAIQAHRVAHRLWVDGRRVLALSLQSKVSEAFNVDIHPAAVIGSGVFLDHATGVVIGETAVVGNNVTIFHDVTLGGTGKTVGDRHPKVGDGVLVGAGAKILGNVKIGNGAKVGAGSVVLKEVPAGTTAVGNPAKVVIGKVKRTTSDQMTSLLDTGKVE